ncbi:MAG: 4'-phosphopantetheinyl transferase superfamily protein [Lachnospiraceae bacterium]|nr:4'-phosphopantetheinyl transferase superfamily protein [Lachnospiraceae bacterium]
MMYIYIWNIAEVNMDKYQGVIERLHAIRKDKIQVRKQKADKDRTLAAGLLLKKAFKDLHLEYDKTEFYLDKNGKPFCDAGIKYNISHSGDRIMLIISSEDCGCDVQLIKKGISVDRLPLSHMTEDERESIGREGIIAFFRIWALKESYVKMTGEGLGRDFRTFSALCPDDNVISESLDVSRFESCGSDPYTEYVNKDQEDPGRVCDEYVYAYCINNKDKLNHERDVHIRYITGDL